MGGELRGGLRHESWYGGKGEGNDNVRKEGEKWTKEKSERGGKKMEMERGEEERGGIETR